MSEYEVLQRRKRRIGIGVTIMIVSIIGIVLSDNFIDRITSGLFLIVGGLIALSFILIQMKEDKNWNPKVEVEKERLKGADWK